MYLDRFFGEKEGVLGDEKVSLDQSWSWVRGSDAGLRSWGPCSLSFGKAELGLEPMPSWILAESEAASFLGVGSGSGYKSQET